MPKSPEQMTDVRPESGVEILKVPELRISTAAFARIRDTHGRFALLVNKGRARKGETWLSPIGGAIEADVKGIEELKSLLQIDEGAFKERGLTEAGGDLRFKMKGADANAYREWFLERRNRETDPSREMREELIEETKLLDASAAGQLELAAYALAGYGAQATEMTLRLLEIFDVDLPDEAMRRLTEAAGEPDTLIHFVTEEEIALGQTKDGLKIAEVSRTLLDPKDTIAPFH